MQACLQCKFDAEAEAQVFVLTYVMKALEKKTHISLDHIYIYILSYYIFSDPAERWVAVRSSPLD